MLGLLLIFGILWLAMTVVFVVYFYNGVKAIKEDRMKCEECKEEDAIVELGEKNLCVDCFDISFGRLLYKVLTLPESKEENATTGATQQGSGE